MPITRSVSFFNEENEPLPNEIYIGAGLTVARRVGVEVVDEDPFDCNIDIEAEWNGELLRYDVDRIEVTRREGYPGVTGETLRRIPVQQLLKRGVNRFVRIGFEGEKGERSVQLSEDEIDRLVEQGPTEESLLWVARIYLIAQIKLDPPVVAVVQRFGFSPRTASNWIRKAREHKFLPQTESVTLEGFDKLEDPLKPKNQRG